MKKNLQFKPIGERLVKFLGFVGVNQSQFALRTHFAESTVSHWVKGRRPITYTQAYKIKAVFPELNPDWLINGEGVMVEYKGLNSVKDDETVYSKDDADKDKIIDHLLSVIRVYQLKDSREIPEAIGGDNSVVSDNRKSVKKSGNTD